MFIERMAWNPKPGKHDEFLDLLREFRERFPAPHAWRIIRCMWGTWNTVAQEIEWESWDEHVRVWTEWGANPEWMALINRSLNLVETAPTREMWEVME